MGRRGPKPLPSTVLRLRGSRRATERAAAEEAPDGEIVAPPFVAADPEALAAFHELRSHLRGLGTQSPAYSLCAGVLAHQAALYARLAEGMRTAGPLPARRKGQHRALQPLQRTAATVRQLCAEFGLTPAARAAQRGESNQGKTANTKLRFFDQAS